MKKLAYCLLLVSATISCKHENPTKENTETPSGIPNIMPYMITDSGVTVFWESATDPHSVDVYGRDKIDLWWAELQDCLGMEAEPPIIRIVDDIRNICPGLENDRGGYCRSYEPAIIVLHVGKAYKDPAESVQEDRRTWNHEMIHHDLEFNGVLIHRQHQPDFLWVCENHHYYNDL